ncbi:hypothetical protein [Stenotrophomonas sp. GZD-301]|uniref:hypothetical protein n=1 Tax=Stenotrophomonas sp. GZD-301 TaxID=3404814 RepID=UPI003BB804C3
MNLSVLPLCPAATAVVAAFAFAVPSAATAQTRSLDGVNFTGPLVTANPAGLPRGHWYIEPYLVRIDSSAHYDSRGARRSRPGSGAWLTVVPIAYGMGERVTAQVNLSAARAEADGARSGAMRAGDTTARLQYLLQAPSADGSRPAISIALMQRFATGSYDRVVGNPLDAQGDGVQRTTFALGMQQVLWLPNDRPLRWRGQLSASPAPARVAVHDSSVYGTDPGFRGSIARGSLVGVSLGAEYSINPRWVAALDVTASRETAQRITGYAPGADGLRLIDQHRPASRSFSLAPAVEYHFSPSVGVIAGVEFSVGGRNSGAFVSPQVALGMFF